MPAHTRAAPLFSFRLNPGGIVIGYILALLAATAGVVAFPFSSISLVLLSVVVGVFFVVAVPIILLAYVFLTITFSRAIMSLSRRLLYGADQDSESQSVNKPFLESLSTDAGLWDRWIDGVRKLSHQNSTLVRSVL